jgi:antirestriction protein ArdC
MFDIYEAVTNRIIEAMEQGTIPWHKPWAMHTVSKTKSEKADSRLTAVSYATGHAYSLLNQMLLGRPGEYVTFKQCQDAGGKVRKGEKSSMVVFWKILEQQKTDDNGKPVADDNGKPIMKTVPILKYYNVFHIDQCEGLTPKHDGSRKPRKPAADKPALPAISPIDAAEAIVSDYATRCKLADLRIGYQDRAFYSPGRDLVSVPEIGQYKHASEYYSTLFHELVHSTGHKSRLDRFSGADAAAAFGDESYSKEELVAEIGSAAICNRIGIETESTFRNSTAYIQNWLNQLRNDKRLIVSAASRADKAVSMILND